MVKAINFDMDGTLADFYGVDNWLEYLVNKDAYPYAVYSSVLAVAESVSAVSDKNSLENFIVISCIQSCFCAY